MESTSTFDMIALPYIEGFHRYDDDDVDDDADDNDGADDNSDGDDCDDADISIILQWKQ